MKSFRSCSLSFDQWAFQEFDIDARSLSIYRIIFAVYVILFVRFGLFTSLAQYPDVFFHPPYGPMLLFGGFPEPIILSVLSFAVCLGAVALLFGYRTTWSSLLTGVSLLVGYGFVYSLGKINHNTLVLIIPLVMAGSNWGTHYSLDALRQRNEEKQGVGWPVAVMAVCLGVAMFTAGMAKIMGGWLDISMQATQAHLVKGFYLNERQALLAPLFVNIGMPWFWEIQDWGTILLEVGFLGAALRLTWLRGFTSAAVFFHLGVLLTMNITFLHQLFVYALFVDWQSIVGSAKVTNRHRFEMKSLLAGGKGPVIIVALAGGLFTFGSPISVIHQLIPFELGVSPVALLLMVGASIFTVWEIIRRNALFDET